MFPALSSAIFGLVACDLFTHPKRRLTKRLPRIKIGFLEIFPSLRIHGKTRKARRLIYPNPLEISDQYR